MEVKLDSLIQKIKQDGVDEAKKQAGEIISKAQQEAAFLIENAQKQAASVVKTAETQAEKTRATTQAALQQAARDVVLTCKEKIKGMFSRALQMKVVDTLSADFLKEVIVSLAGSWQGERQLQILANPSDLARLQELVYAQLKQDLRKTVVFSSDHRVGKGIRIGIKDEHVYYDLTDESVAALLAERLSPQMQRLLEKE